MKVILYKPTLNDRGALFTRQVLTQTTQKQLVVCVLLEQLVDAIATRNGEDIIIVLLAEDREHLRMIYNIHDVLFGHKCILVLPDMESETISLGHHLRPRFITDFSAPPENLGAVLTKMLQNFALNFSDVSDPADQEALGNEDTQATDQACNE